MKPEKEQSYEALAQMANSDVGQKLKQSLQNDRDPAIQEAIQRMQTGDYSQAGRLLEKLMEAPETAEILRQLRGGK